jgi:peptide/nickel transport system substrate-binding protein
LAVVAAMGMLAAACGGGSKKPSATGQADETTTTAVGATEETTGTTAALAPGESTSTTAGGSGTKTAVTSKSTATTAKKSSTAITGAPQKTPTGGITNVTAAPTTAPRSDITPGGTLTYLKVADGPGLDPIRVSNSGNSDGPPAFMIYDMLAYTSLQDGMVKPQTMESLTSTDAVVWTMKLRPNIKFSDGTPYDAAAVKFNYQRLADPAKTAQRAAQAQTIASMDVIDPLTLKLTLKTKNALFPYIVALIAFVGSPKAINEIGDDKFNNAPIGAGPFTLKSWTRDSEMVLVRNPNYWNAPLPYLDQVIAKPIQDESQRINTFQAGQANFMYTNQAQSSVTLTKGGGVPYPAIINGGTLMYFNTRVKPFNDVRLRQAITMAIDRNDINGVDNGNVIPPMHSIFRDNSPFYDPGILQLQYDPVKAQQLIDQVAADNGGPISFNITSFNTGVYNAALPYIQAKLNGMKNLKVTVEPEASSVHQLRVPKGDFQAALYASPFDDPEPAWTTIYVCNAVGSPTGWCDPKFDALMTDQRETLDPNKRVQDIKDAQKLMYAQAPVFFFEKRAAWDFGAPNVQGVTLVNDGLALYDRIWIKK